MTKALKCGYLLRYKRRLFSRTWREEFIVLYDDSSIAWFKDKSRQVADGGLVLSQAPDLMAVGEHTARIPVGRPASLPRGCSLQQVMAFGTPDRRKVHWFVAKSREEVSEWMAAIGNTLPTPPQLPVYAEIDEVKTNIYEPVDLQNGGGGGQPRASGPEAAAATAAAAAPASASAAGDVGDVSTCLMLATGFTTWGWGYGLGWTTPAGVESMGAACDLDAFDPHYYPTSSASWNHADPDCYNDFADMDFGGDFGF